MATYRLTLELPEPVFQKLVRIAELSNQSLESLAIQSITSNLPPSVEHAPLHLQGELLSMQNLPVEELVKITRMQVSPTAQERHLTLLDKNANDSITAAELEEIRDLRIDADRLMLSKASAWSLLRWRGYPIQPLEYLPVE
ncbi:MAG TPA: hypothetical protein IGS52_02135 [Oscillatoriaceae cyanobacterium M33_DOE_052]|uniref:EF-hand domain-containing protein n=1 Tax=Planktothricoides sp. SpSt-374 TaxID=2282167 RepID=A0A7C3VSS0_9CYAN|nr:hypothetical protein [Oscillatoriaceae cyanobacterium M33_DOE_052]